MCRGLDGLEVGVRAGLALVERHPNVSGDVSCVAVLPQFRDSLASVINAPQQVGRLLEPSIAGCRSVDLVDGRSRRVGDDDLGCLFQKGFLVLTRVKLLQCAISIRASFCGNVLVL